MPTGTRGSLLPNGVVLETCEIFLVCEECKKLFTMPSSRFAKRLKEGATNFFCSRKCYAQAIKLTKDLEYVKNRLINETLRDEKTGCWLLITKRKRYGNLRLNRTWVSAHKASYLLFNGPVEDGLQIRHTCHNVKCVNPEHLTLGTCKQNMEDKVKAGRQPRGEKHGNAKLTQAQVDEIRRLWSLNDFGKTRPKPYNYSVLGKMFGVSDFVIMRIIKRLNWRDATDQENTELES